MADKKNIKEENKGSLSEDIKQDLPEKKENSKTASQEKEVKKISKKGKKQYIYAVGKRKSASAQVRLYKKGSGEVLVNEQDVKDYFPTGHLQSIVYAPLKVVGQNDKLKVWSKVKGGGKVGQAEAIRHGIAKALLEINPNFRKPLRKQGFLTRDPRVKERKKPGLKRARRAPQWSKR